ncbi:MAG: SpoIID/LytB domain-containing protein [bacterium]
MMQNLKKSLSRNKYIFITLILSMSVFLLNIYYYVDITPAENINDIRVGISNYQNFTSIGVGFNNSNSDISLSFGNNEVLKNSLELRQNEKLVAKAVSRYSIISNSSFNSYQEAKSYADTLQNGYAYLKNGSWYVIDGVYSYEKDANAYWTSSDSVEGVKKISQSDGKIELVNNSIGVYINDKLNFVVQENLYMKASDGLFTLGKNTYRNIIQIRNSTSTTNLISAINLINIEDYLYSVVPNEMPALWHEEALKAQSIACRNFAYSNMNVHIKDGYNICNTNHCQVYEGIANEHEKTTEAVKQTENIFIYHDDEIINAVYSSSNGGYSENSEDVWYDEVPYLKAIPDIHEANAKEWSRTFSFQEISNLAKVGEIQEIQLDILTESQRVLNLILVGADGTKIVEKDTIRTFFEPTSEGSLDSKNFYIEGAVLSARESTDPNFIKDEIIEVFDVFTVANKEQLGKDEEDSLELQKLNSEQEVFVLSKDGEQTQKLNSKFAINYVGEIHKLEYRDILSENNLLDNSDIYNNNLAPNEVIKKVITSGHNNSITLVGRGWGHGVGMSQYGANSLANNGFGYEEILKYYYTDVEVR